MVEAENENGSVGLSTVVDDASTPYFSLRAPSRALASQTVPEGVLPEGITSRSPTAFDDVRGERAHGDPTSDDERSGAARTVTHEWQKRYGTVRTFAVSPLLLTTASCETVQKHVPLQYTGNYVKRTTSEKTSQPTPTIFHHKSMTHKNFTPGTVDFSADIYIYIHLEIQQHFT